MHSNQLNFKEFSVRGLFVGTHLPLFFVWQRGIPLIRQLSRRIKCCHSHTLTSLRIVESGRHFTIIEIFQTPPTQAYPGSSTQRIGHTPIYLNPYYQFFPVCSSRVADVAQTATEYSHSSTEHLPRTKMAVQDFTFVQYFLEGRQHIISLLM
jgi:hypothetical protein